MKYKYSTNSAPVSCKICQSIFLIATLTGTIPVVSLCFTWFEPMFCLLPLKTSENCSKVFRKAPNGLKNVRECMYFNKTSWNLVIVTLTNANSVLYITCLYILRLHVNVQTAQKAWFSYEKKNIVRLLEAHKCNVFFLKRFNGICLSIVGNSTTWKSIPNWQWIHFLLNILDLTSQAAVVV